MEDKIRKAVDGLNAAMGRHSPYKVDLVDPKALKPAPVNAHYMEKAMFDNLVENIQMDGNLSSIPFCWKPGGDGPYIILSGHHRVEAAIAAGVEQILIFYDDRSLDQQARIAVQLSHNALVGRDSIDVLRQLWGEIEDLGLKIYTGLDETKLQEPDPPKLNLLSDMSLRIETITLSFIRPETERAEEIMKALERHGRTHFVGDVADFDRFFELLLDFKEKTDILNTSTAFKAMLEIVENHLDGLSGGETPEVKRGSKTPNKKATRKKAAPKGGGPVGQKSKSGADAGAATAGGPG